MLEINDLLRAALSSEASDLHLKVGSPPIVRIMGDLMPLPSAGGKVTPDDIIKIASAVMKPEQMEAFKKKHELDFAYSVPGFGRFRCNAFIQRGTVAMVFRVIPPRVLSIEELYLPTVINQIAMEERGLVLVTGTTGSGKSTTLASMIDLINMNRTCNIITIEDPIEFLHRDKKGLVSQREVGSDTETFGIALRSALRQDPDVILVGEMRDFETIQTALIAAETGHLVFSTLHTTDAAETVNRIISVFPPYQHKEVRMQLAAVLKGIISMRLMPRADKKGRIPAIEVLVATETIKECITDPDKTKNISEVISQGKIIYGMQTFDQSLLDLYKSGLITYEEALRRATNPDDFVLKVKGIQSTSDLAMEKQSKPAGKKIEIDRFSR